MKWQITDTNKGKYMPLACIVESEGGNSPLPGAKEAAILAAQNYAKKAAQMGGRWTRTNSFTGRLEFLYLNAEVAEEFSRCWAAYEQHSDGGEVGVGGGAVGAGGERATASGSGGASGAGREVEGEGDKPATKKVTTAAEGAREAAAGDDASTKKKGGKKEPTAAGGEKGGRRKAGAQKDAAPKTPYEQAVCRASDLKRDIQQFQSMYANITTAVRCDQDWKWATSCLSDLTSAATQVDSCMTSWGRSLLCMEFKTFKQSADDKEFITKTAEFDDRIGKAIAEGLRQARMLMRMHQGRTSA